MCTTPTFDFDTTSEAVATHHSAQIHSKTILITGVSQGGLGLYIAKVLASHSPGLLILAARTTSSLQSAKADILAQSPDCRLRLLELDIGCFRTVRAAAAVVNSWEDVEGIDALINNAGVMSTPFALNEDGVESQFATNHLGPWLFTNLVMGKVVRAEGRVVNVASVGHVYGGIRWEDWNFKNGEEYDPDAAYGQSKTANILSAISIAEKLKAKGVMAFSVHPGLILTNLTRSIPTSTLQAKGFLDEDGKYTNIIPQKSFAQGTATTLVAALDPDIVKSSGAYLVDCKVEHDDVWAEHAKGLENAERLWELSEKLAGQRFEY